MSIAKKENKFTRRSFLKIIGLGSFITTLIISAGSFVRFIFPRVIFEPAYVFSIGFPDEFKVNGESDGNGVVHVYEKWKKDRAVWIVREKDRMYAIHSKCTHLGCTPNWFAEEGVFKCPCHGSQFDSNGNNFSGPAPRPLDRLRIALADDGSIIIDKSRVYTFTEFDKQGAYVEV